MMKKLLMGLMLLMTATAASAEWTQSGEGDSFIHYVDRATIRRNGNFVKMWNLLDYKTMQKTDAGDSFLSSKAQDEYDCKEERRRTFAFLVFSEQMGKGKVVSSNIDPGKWNPIPPGSNGEVLWKIACGKK